VNLLTEVLTRVSAALTHHGIDHMVIGGQAVLVHGEARFTQDIDVTLALSPGDVSQLLAVCADASLAIGVENPSEFVASTHVLPAIDSQSGTRIDFVFSSTGYERVAIGRSQTVQVGGHDLPFATMEDLIIHKLLAARPRDLEDIRGIVRKRRDEIDWGYVERWVEAFSEAPGQERLAEHLAEVRG
jgi:hypothetical protein